jgi:hypothetical protein
MTSKDYFVLQDKAAEAYRQKDYASVKEACLTILQNISSIIKDMGETRGSFGQLYKPFIDDALNIVSYEGLDETEEKIIKKLFSEKLITKEEILEHYEITGLQETEFAESLYHFLSKIGILTKKEAEEYIEGKETEATIAKNSQYEAIENKILEYLRNNPGFLQKDLEMLFTRFPLYNQYDVEMAYSGLLASGKIERKKEGRTYVLMAKDEKNLCGGDCDAIGIGGGYND